MKKRKNVSKFKIIIYVLFIILFGLVIDKLFGNNVSTLILNIKNSSLIKDNPDSLIISVNANKDLVAVLPIITYDTISINWGDGHVEEFKSYKLEEKKKKYAEGSIFYDILEPTHKYSRKGQYSIVITGNTNRGLFGDIDYTPTGGYMKSLLQEDYLNKLPVYTGSYDDTYDKYILENVNNSIYTYKIIHFKNLNFKGLGSLTKYFTGEIPIKWVNEFNNIEIFITTFANSDITTIPKNIFMNCSNLRMLISTFFNCQSLKSIPENLIKDVTTVENVTACFAYSSNIEGLAPEWWKTMTKIKDTNYVEDIPYILCFSECKKLENFKDIPFLWGGYIEAKREGR